jgi:hypothetical protein
MELRRVVKEHSRYRTLVVEEGEVICPRQGVVDLERCWVCPAYGGLSEGRVQGVICTMNLADLRIGPQPTIR